MNRAAHEQNVLNQLPKPIAQKLLSLVSRIKRVVLLRGALGVCAVAIGAVLSLMAIDEIFTVRSLPLRWTMTLSGMALVALAAWRWLIRPLRNPVDVTTVSRKVGERHTELQEPISSDLQLSTYRNDR
ncbi:MAG: hypothetical protein R3236_12030 [Phycisphaeraceae bacterium]|nr:hypothetical protein [Phycisphaeraceae bacterium]